MEQWQENHKNKRYGKALVLYCKAICKVYFMDNSSVADIWRESCSQVRTFSVKMTNKRLNLRYIYSKSTLLSGLGFPISYFLVNTKCTLSTLSYLHNAQQIHQRALLHFLVFYLTLNLSLIVFFDNCHFQPMWHRS